MTDQKSEGVELTNAQFERLVGMLAENRVALQDGLREISEASRLRYIEIKKQLSLHQSTLDVVQGDLIEVQKSIHGLAETQAKHDTALGGLTELASTNFELIESINKHIHGESSRITHGAEAQGQRPQ